ncbi:hypothetical protein QBC36DRAFT_313833 [Triangularia setosa]|uniref:Uncharacterized protein n=1 Tax=Triangularia setosa TaxID=2587417 RepID=A0AAN6W221_9PEZI|nr:hypothetical protein QBC36DRAFT_313833 [Podospora setosa]
MAGESDEGTQAVIEQPMARIGELEARASQDHENVAANSHEFCHENRHAKIEAPERYGGGKEELGRTDALRSEINDKGLIQLFYNGLKDEVKDELYREERPDTIDKYIAIAIRIDDRQFQRRMEKRRARQSRDSTNDYTDSDYTHEYRPQSKVSPVKADSEGNDHSTCSHSTDNRSEPDYVNTGPVRLAGTTLEYDSERKEQ